MKILYVGVHTNEKWRTEYWLSNAFIALGHKVIKYDYKSNRKKIKSWKAIGREIFELEKDTCPDIVFLQRGKKMSTKVLNQLTKPIFFWSTEPLNLKTDVDKLLNSNIYKWVFVHSYSCLDRIKIEFSHLFSKCSVMHNACPSEFICLKEEKTIFAIFNRNLSNRRRKWLQPSLEKIELIQGKFGKDYFNDLQKSIISINIHYSDKNIDDFETGIFEGMASGCLIISEKLNPQTLLDLEMTNVIIQVDSPKELNNKLELLKANPHLITDYMKKTKKVIQQNTWDQRANAFMNKFNEFI